MSIILRYILFIILAASLFTGILFADTLRGNDKTFIVQKLFKQENFKYWAKLDGSSFCSKDFNYSDSTPFSKYVGTKVNVIYLTGVDIKSCAEFIPKLADNFHFYGIQVALDLDAKFETKSVLAEDNSLKITDYLNQFKSLNSSSEWISYIVIDNVIQGLTFTERRSFQSELRDIFKKSFIGFRFTNDVSPTPDMKHPLRTSIDWNEFLPRDDDGDFVITTFPVGNFKRTSIISENIIAATDDVDGQFVEIN